MRQLADLYLENSEGKDVRWVYSPQHKPDLSNVLSRQADGYRLVKVEDLGEDLEHIVPGLEPDEPVRVGDVVLMSIAADVRQGIFAELQARAVAERDRVEENFYAAIEEIEASKDEYQPRARGRSVIEEVEREVEVDESLKD